MCRHPRPFHGTPTRTELAVCLAGVVSAPAGRQPQFPPPLDGADRQRNRRLVLYPLHLHAAPPLDWARQLARPGPPPATSAPLLPLSHNPTHHPPPSPPARQH